MQAFRIARAAFGKDALTGEGSRLYGGRGNSRGTAIVYTASSRSLAVLELLIHTGINTVPTDLVLVELDIPDDLQALAVALDQLPEHWRQTPAPGGLAVIGDSWVKEARSPVLHVPSAVVPAEICILINPRHREARSIRIMSHEPLVLDPRLL